MEHLTMIKAWKKEQNYIKRPQLDEWQLEEFQMVKLQAITNHEPVVITTWDDGQFLINEGLLKEVNPYHNECLLQCELVNKRLQLSAICDITLCEEMQ